VSRRVGHGGEDTANTMPVPSRARSLQQFPALTGLQPRCATRNRRSTATGRLRRGTGGTLSTNGVMSAHRLPQLDHRPSARRIALCGPSCVDSPLLAIFVLRGVAPTLRGPGVSFCAAGVSACPRPRWPGSLRTHQRHVGR
jgi:hypothetical protein